MLDFVRDPYFTKETVAKEQGIIGQEIKMYDDSPDWRVMMNLISSMFQNHPVRKDIAGTVETIAEITPELLYTCYNSYYNLNNMVLSVAGNVTPEQVIAIVDEILTKQDEPLDTQSIFPDEPYEVGQDYVEQKLSVAVPLFQLGFKEDAGDKRLSSKELPKQIFFCLLLQERLHHFISDFLMMSLSIKALDMSISRKWVIVQ